MNLLAGLEVTVITFFCVTCCNSVLAPEAISSRTAVMSFQAPRRCWRVESLDMSQALTRRRDGAKCVWGEGECTMRADRLAAKAGRIRRGSRLRERLLIHIIRPQHPNGRGLRRRCTRRDEQRVQFRNEE